MKIADTGKADNQPLSPDAYQAQQAEIARLSQAVQLAEAENQGLRARVAELEELLEMQRGATDAVIADKNRILEMSNAAIGVLQTRVTELEALTAWRSIESAPLFEDSGETRVIVCGGRHKKPVAITPDGEWWRIEAARGSKAVPTHWMPMPDALETPQNPSICPQEPPVVVSGGDSASGKEYEGMAEEPYWDKGWADGVSGVCMGRWPEAWTNKQRDAYCGGWNKGRKRYVEDTAP